MPNWNIINDEMSRAENPDQLLSIQGRYLTELENFVGKPVICYYSGFLDSNLTPDTEISINDNDMNGFMSVLSEITREDREKGLVLVLHTPGGSPTAAEAIVNYLKVMFNNDITVIVPHMAMSAGTMIACAAKKIIMGNHSSLGPIDPQFQGIPAYNIQSEFEEAEHELEKNPNSVQFWAIRLQQYPAAFLKSATDAIQLSSVLLEKWLGDSMFDSIQDHKTIQNIVGHLNEHANSLVHDRHFNIVQCREFGLKVEQLEENQELQDKVLSLHHATIELQARLRIKKTIQNKIAGKFITQGN